MASEQKPGTLGVRAGGIRSDFQEHSEGLVLTTSFVYKSAAEAARRFANEEPGNIYSRFTNPTVTMFQSRLAALEGAQACVATATGMAAVATMALGLLKAGDHLIAARGVFGTVVPLFDQILKKLSIETTWVDLGDLDAWRKAVRPSTRLIFVETPSNPVCEVADIAALAQIAKQAGAILAVDNAMVSPALQRPIEFGADIVIHSATKYLEGQGRVLAGAICGRADLVNGPLFSFVRTAGPAISPFNAWIVLKGMETLRIRMEAQSRSTLEIARWLEGHPAIERLHYPGLESHPQHALARRQMRGFGGMIAFELRGGLAAGARMMDRVKLCTLAVSLGHTKSLICHSASTTHSTMAREERLASGITDGLVRLSVGLEDVEDLMLDLDQAMR